MKKFRVGIVGAGLIGGKRAQVAAADPQCELVFISDIDLPKARSLADQHHTRVEVNWKKSVSKRDVDILVIATVNKSLKPIAGYALSKKIHVLCEKPLGRNAREAKCLYDAAVQNRRVLKVGFNHRHHPAIYRARMLMEEGVVGRLFFMRCRYGHGGRKGYEREWRADRDLCGGGELLDQGVHVIDLFRWFAGDFHDAIGYTPTYFWKIKMEDNAIAVLRNRQGVTATFHTSWTQWKNLFSFEVFGEHGALIVDGLGGSYGPETLTIVKRKKEFGVPDVERIEFPPQDVSWSDEWAEFTSAIRERRSPLGSGWDGYRANRIIDAIYESSRKGRIVKIKD